MKVGNLRRGVKRGVLAALCVPSAATAHVSEQGFVLLLPTGAYTAAGVAVVALTVVALLFLPLRIVVAMFAPRRLRLFNSEVTANVTSIFSFFVMIGLIWLGLTGSRDPLSNLMPLSVWTIGWIALVSLSLIFGNLWYWLNPWRGMLWVFGLAASQRNYPAWLGVWPANLTLIAFSGFLLADIAPDDPARLARLAAAYWLYVFCGCVLFGQAWLDRAELGHVLIGSMARLSPVRLLQDSGIGMPGWQLIERTPVRGLGMFCLIFLGVGSFDGLNETFWWLAQIGVNPLEFPGRSAVVRATVTGLGLSVVLLIGVFALTLWIGRVLAGDLDDFWGFVDRMAVSVLPIAAGYHVAHYLTSFLVNIQYWIAALSDPLARGDDFLGIEPFRVTTGFFNAIDSVRMIWFAQASAVVLGHVLSVLVAHRIALSVFENPQKATRATLPLSVFMIAYTFLGLWLLAAPKGA